MSKCWKCEGEAELVVYRRAREPRTYTTCVNCIVQLVDMLQNTGTAQLLVERVKP